MPDRRLEDVLRAGDHHLDGPDRLLGALSDTQRRLVEDEVRAFGERINERCVADITCHHVQTPSCLRRPQILHPAADEVIQDHDAVGTCCQQLVGDMRTDEAGASSDEDAGAVEASAIRGHAGLSWRTR